MQKLRFAFVLAAVAGVCLASAQNGAQGGPPVAGPRGGAGSLNSPQRPKPGLPLYLRPAVETELQLTPDQITQLKGAVESGVKGKELEDKIKAILNPQQFKRLTELRLQAAGPAALARPGIARKIGLSSDQADKIGQIVAGMRQQIQALQPGKERAREARDIRDKSKEQMLAVLTPEQQKSWEEMLGKPFEFGKRN